MQSLGNATLESSDVSIDGSVVVGFARDEDWDDEGRNGALDAFIWTATDGLTIQDSLTSSYSGISGDGSVVSGTRENGNAFEVFRLTVEDGVMGLGWLPGYLQINRWIYIG